MIEYRMELIVPPGTSLTRLDRFLARQLPGLSRRKIRVHGAGFRINGRPAPRSAPVRSGDRIYVPDALTASFHIEPSADLSLPLLYQDETLLAVDKPPQLPTVIQERGENRSVASFLVTRFPELREVGSSPLEAGLAHRLDRDTSGVLLAARTPHAYTALRHAFAAHQVCKEYLALVAGDLADPGCVRTPLAHDRRHAHRMRLCPTPESQRCWKARPAETKYRPQLRYGLVTLVHLTLRTGVMHQIRLHLAAIGHPVVGDPIYGAPLGLELEAPRQVLHAHRLCFRHPASGQPIAVESPLPADVQQILRYCAAAQR